MLFKSIPFYSPYETSSLTMVMLVVSLHILRDSTSLAKLLLLEGTHHQLPHSLKPQHDSTCSSEPHGKMEREWVSSSHYP
jgi:hypothetical protein